MIIFVFFNFLAFWPFPWQRQPFWKNQPLKAQLHMAYDIPTRFHKVWSRHLREIERTKMCGRRIRIIIIITRNDMIWRSLMAPNSKNYDGYQFTRTKSTWKQNFPQIWGFLYFKKLRKLAKHQKWKRHISSWYHPLSYQLPLTSKKKIKQWILQPSA